MRPGFGVSVPVITPGRTSSIRQPSRPPAVRMASEMVSRVGLVPGGGVNRASVTLWIGTLWQPATKLIGIAIESARRTALVVMR